MLIYLKSLYIFLGYIDKFQLNYLIKNKLLNQKGVVTPFFSNKGGSYRSN